MSPIDPVRLAGLPRNKPLTITDGGAFTCVICGAPQEPHSWRVKLPAGAGPACPGCASDHGWETR